MANKRTKVKVFSALEVADICGVVNQTAINWIKRSQLKAFTTPGGQYRIYAEDLKDFLEKRGIRVPESVEKEIRTTSKRDILLVDNDIAFNNKLKDLIEAKMKNVRVVQAFDAFEAGRLVSLLDAKIVLFDLNLPGFSGIPAFKKIYAKYKDTQTNLLFFSSNRDGRINKVVDKENPKLLFAKPIEFDKLLMRIDELLQ